MSFQTCKTSVHLQNTIQNISDEIRELSDPPIDSKSPTTIKAQKRSTETLLKRAMWHQGFNRNFTKLQEYFFGTKKRK